MIRGIQEDVPIPVMAKARIGHFAEAQVLEALEVDYVDESEVLTPADEAHHIDKWGFKRPVRVRRDEPGRSAAAHRRGRGDDPQQGRGGHRRHRRGRPPHARDRAARCGAWARWTSAELPSAAKELRAPLDLVRQVARDGQSARRPLLRGRHRHARGRLADDAAGAEGVFVGLGHLQVAGPADRARARSSRPTTHFEDPERVARASEGAGRGDDLAGGAQARRRASSWPSAAGRLPWSR